MRIIFFTQEDPFYVKVFFDEFFRLYKSLDDIKAIVISKPMGKKSMFALAKQMYHFYGPIDFLRVGFKFVYLKGMGKKRVKKNAQGIPSKTYTVKQLAVAYGIEVIERSDLNSKEFISFIKQYNADLFISVACPIIFKEKLINVPNVDSINIHNAPLPKYRGMLPNFWQMYHGEKEAGITIHRIEKGIDTGDILLQDYIPINAEETLHDLIIKTKKHGARLMVKVINSFKDGNINYIPMKGQGSYYSFPSRYEVVEFKGMGKRLM